MKFLLRSIARSISDRQCALGKPTQFERSLLKARSRSISAPDVIPPGQASIHSARCVRRCNVIRSVAIPATLLASQSLTEAGARPFGVRATIAAKPCARLAARHLRAVE